MDGVTCQRIATNGIHLNVAQAGPADGPLVLLLHGFPEFWYGWRHQIPALVAAGYCVWAADQRGFNLSDKPPRVQDYCLDQLAADAAGLIAAAGRRRALVVGHDWGGVVAWWLAANHPELVERLVIINVPHPLVMRRLILTNPRQTLRSWYVFALQVPWLFEWSLARNDWRDLVRGLRNSSRPGAFTDADFVEYRRAWSQPGAILAMLNWYRAPFRAPPRPPRSKRILPPTLILWGKQDKFVLPVAAERSLQLCDQGQLQFYENATHWLPHEEPAEVNRQILNFAGQAAAPSMTRA
ncbi:MAG TPA: alpha/beta hydrolase [Pirellulaceae bacterium]|nr:alpha/beta hydrolase [Pirellulaceae bacterium]